MTPDPVRDAVLEGLGQAAGALEAVGAPVPPLGGKLLRPVAAWASVPAARRDALDLPFWLGALAIQMAHEASLLHDDVVDAATTRRGRPTLAADRGVPAALLQGDHWLTAAYRAAAMTGSAVFVERFAAAVERTVAGEARQARAAGRMLDEGEYDAIVTGKSGELFGASTALHACLTGGPVESDRAVGLRLGALYQRIDDLLDYLPGTDRGKPPLQDWRQGKWTWVLGEAGVDDFDGEDADVLELLRREDGRGGTPLSRCLARIRTLADEIVERHAERTGDRDVLPAVVEAWVDAAVRAAGEVDGSAALRPGTSIRRPGLVDGVEEGLAEELAARARRLGGPADWPAYFGEHARTFRFASRLFPGWAADRVAEVYAFCRFTDDLVDEAPPGTDPAFLTARLGAWSRMARRAHEGHATDVPLLDVVMGRMANAYVPFRYVEALCEGVAADAETVRMATTAELETYTWRVAGVVGEWLTRLFGVHDPEVLERAGRLGHAMQLTNILRDVGEDWRAGRLYLPADLLERHGVDEAMVAGVARGAGPVPLRYRAVLEELMDEADRAYDEALEAVPSLPAWYGRPVAVAARAYQAIHREIRRNGHDNGTRRAQTSTARKLVVAVRALLELRRLRRELNPVMSLPAGRRGMGELGGGSVGPAARARPVRRPVKTRG